MVILFFGMGISAIHSGTLSAITAEDCGTENKFIVQKLPLFDALHLETLGLSRQVFTYALRGFSHLLASGKVPNEHLLTILDFSLPSHQKRLFVIDLKTGELVFNTYAAHGRNSGKDMATRFSNKPNSFQSSLGFYITGETYRGKHGSSLRLLGEEEGFNDNALSRGIVIHGAEYVSENIAAAQGYIGRSQGCPALPGKQSAEVISRIKNGTCLFLYGQDTYYLTHSKILNNRS